MSAEARSTPAHDDASRPTGPREGVRRLRVLVVDQEIPYPLDSGKRIRTFEVLRRLAREFEIVILHPEHDSPQNQARAWRAAAGVQV